jgi:hypothetical protein
MPNGIDIPEERATNPPRLLLIGRREYVSFPEWGVLRLRAKIDTGAWSSALGVHHYELCEDPRLGQAVQLQIAPSRRHPDRVQTVLAPVLRMVKVTSSNGTRQSRPLIEVPVQIGPVLRRIRMTVSDRNGLRCPILLGRQALAGVFLVDVSRKYLLPR